MAFNGRFIIKSGISACMVCVSSYFLYSNCMLRQHIHRHRFTHPAAQGQQDVHENDGEVTHMQ